MNKFRYIFLFLIILSFTPNLSAQIHKNKIRIKFIDKENHKRVPFVAVSESKGDIFLGEANKKGIFKIETYLKIDSLICSAIGYETYVLSINDLKKNKKIYLKPNVQHLEEIVVKGFSLDYLLKTTFKKHLERLPKFKHYALCEHIKTQKINGKYVEMMYDNGILKNTNHTKFKQGYYGLYFKYSPINIKLSNAYNSEKNSDTIKKRIYKTDTIMNRRVHKYGHFNSIYSDILDVYVSNYHFGPITKKFYKYYLYKLDSVYQENGKDIYRVHFKSLDKKCPRKFKIDCSGYLYIQKETYSIKKITFDYLNYSYIHACGRYGNKKKYRLPFTTNIAIKYKLFKNIVFPIEIQLKKKWLKASEKLESVRYYKNPSVYSREYKEGDDYEITEILKYHKICYSDYYKDFRKIDDRIYFQECLTNINYNPKLFISSPNFYKDLPKVYKDLSKYEPIEEQFKKHHNFFIKGLKIDPLYKQYEETIMYILNHIDYWSQEFIKKFNIDVDTNK